MGPNTVDEPSTSAKHATAKVGTTSLDECRCFALLAGKGKGGKGNDKGKGKGRADSFARRSLQSFRSSQCGSVLISGRKGKATEHSSQGWTFGALVVGMPWAVSEDGILRRLSQAFV